MKRIKFLLACLLLVGCTSQPVDPVVPDEPVVDIKEDSVVSIMAVGDNLIHGAIYMDAYARHGKYEFNDIYEPVTDFVKSYDIAYINQETVLGGTKLGLSHYPMFNSPQEVGEAVVNAGFDWVNVASNHSMDKFEKGIRASIEFWDKYENIVTTGMNRSEEESKENKYIVKNDVKFGILGYTYGTNGISLPKGKDYLVNIYSKDRIKEDVERLKGTCDAILVSMHWGVEYTTKPTAEQKELAQYMADLGVTAIIGEHPHVIQPMEYVTGKDGNETLVIYSLGNFLSSQDSAMGMLGGAASFDVRKNGETGEITLENVKWYPTVTHYNMGGNFNKGTRNYKVYLLKDYTNEMAKNHGLNPRVNYVITRDYFIKQTEKVIGDKFEIVY